MKLYSICKIKNSLKYLNEGLKLANIFQINQKRLFTLEQANDLLPLIYRITEESSKEVKYLMSCIDALPEKNSETSHDLQNRINSIIERWQNKLERLGMRPKGLWLADFDYGDGYFCWKFPETKIQFQHGYQDGFTGRTLITGDSVVDAKAKRDQKHESSPSPN